MTKSNNGHEPPSRQSIAFPIVISKAKSSSTTAPAAAASSPSCAGSTFGTPPSTSASTLLSHHLALDDRPRTTSGGSTSSSLAKSAALEASSSPSPRRSKHSGPPSLLKPRRPTSATSFEVDFSGIQTPRRRRDDSGEGSSSRSSSLTRVSPSQPSPVKTSAPDEASRPIKRRGSNRTTKPSRDDGDGDEAPSGRHLTPLQKQIRSDGQRISSFLDGSDDIITPARQRWTVRVNVSLSICRPYVALLRWTKASRAWTIAQTNIKVPLPVARGGWVEWGVAKVVGAGRVQSVGDAGVKARRKIE